MPGYRGHLIGGAVSYMLTLTLLVSKTPNILTAFEWLGFSLIGSLFPDIDITSKGRFVFYRIFLIVALLCLWWQHFVGFCFITILMILSSLVTHRGLFHRWWFIVGISLAAAMLCTCSFGSCKQAFLYDTLFFIMGALSHLYLDLGFKRMMRI